MDINLLFAATEAAKPSLEMGLRVSLSTMNFLELAIWGAWFVVLGQYLEALKFSRGEIGRIYSTMAFGSIFAPMIVGSIVDRYFNSEHVMSVLHFAGAGLLYLMAHIRTARKFYWVALLYALVYSPTLTLSQSIVFGHIPDPTRDFPTIRVLGTIGWIVPNLCLIFLLKKGEPVNNRPLLLAAVLSVVLAVYALFLPATPPPKNPVAIPFLKAVELLKEPSFAVFFGVSFLITIALAFYYSFTSLFLERRVGVRSNTVGPLMTIGQWSEIGFMLALPWFIESYGMKIVFLIGMAAWAIRYGIFALGGPFPLIVLGLALHGICYDFFFAAGFIHVAETAPPEIIGSGQALFGTLTYGLGMYFGTEASGWVNQMFTRETVDEATQQPVRVTDWQKFWLIPCVGVVISLVAFAVLYR